ncbi:MAG: AarF/UbiB family protein [Planctomycetota bacterium]
MDLHGRAGKVLGAASRATVIARALTQFGFGEVLTQTGLDKLIKGVTGISLAEDVADKPVAVRVRLMIESLGPTFIKAGQILSTRPDLIPPDWAEELKELQSGVPPVAWEGDDGVKAALELEYGARLDDLFESVETEALAAASMAQVHRAVVIGGQKVVLKVLRPGIRQTIAGDLELMELIAKLTRGYFLNFGFDAEAVVAEFSRQLERETDLTIEAHSTMRMADDFREHPAIGFPAAHLELTRRGVLALDEVQGTVLSNVDPATMPEDQRLRVVSAAADAVFKQCLEIGFFHADPHPGNMFLVTNDHETDNDEGPPERVVFIDCGMTGLIDPGTMNQLADLVHGVVDGNLTRVVKTSIALGGADPTLADDRAFRSDVYQFMDNFSGGSLQSLRMGRLLSEFFELLRRHKLMCPADIAYLIKAVTTIEGVAEEIAPEFDLIAHVHPYVERLIKQRYSVTGLLDRLKGSAAGYASLAEDIPGDARDIIQQIKHNRLSLNLDHRGLDKLTAEIERASINIAWAFVVAAIIVGAALLILADSVDRSRSTLTVVASIVFGAALALGVFRLVWSRIER